MAERAIETNGIRMRVHERGEGPAVVLDFLAGVAPAEQAGTPDKGPPAEPKR